MGCLLDTRSESNNVLKEIEAEEAMVFVYSETGLRGSGAEAARKLWGRGKWEEGKQYQECGQSNTKCINHVFNIIKISMEWQFRIRFGMKTMDFIGFAERAEARGSYAEGSRKTFGNRTAVRVSKRSIRGSSRGRAA